MVRYKRQFEAVRDSHDHEMGSFWLRKTGKAVLAVLLTRKPDGSPTYWRGMVRPHVRRLVLVEVRRHQVRDERRDVAPRARRPKADRESLERPRQKGRSVRPFEDKIGGSAADEGDVPMWVLR